MTLKQYSGMAVVSQKLSESTARMWTPQRPPERNRDLQTSRQSQKSVSVETKRLRKSWDVQIWFGDWTRGFPQSQQGSHQKRTCHGRIKVNRCRAGNNCKGGNAQATNPRCWVGVTQGRKWRARCAQEERWAFSRFAFPLPAVWLRGWLAHLVLGYLGGKWQKRYFNLASTMRTYYLPWLGIPEEGYHFRDCFTRQHSDVIQDPISGYFSAASLME